VAWPSSAADTGEKARIVCAKQVCGPPVSANRARNPKGRATANMVLGPFASTTKVALFETHHATSSAAGAKHGKIDNVEVDKFIGQ